MNARTLNVLWPHHRPFGWGICALAVVLLAFGALGFDDDARLETVSVTATWLAIGLLLGWHLKRLQLWAAAPLVPRFLITEALGHQGLLIGLWLLWLLAMQPTLVTAELTLIAASIGICSPFVPVPIGLGGSAIILAAALSRTAHQWLAVLPIALGITGASVIALITVIVRVIRAAHPARPQPLRWFWAGMLLDHDRPPKPIAESLALALRVGARQSWILTGIILAITSLVTLVTVFRPEARPDLLAMLFPVWMVGMLSMPALVHVNSVRSLDRLWLTGAFKTRRTFARAVVAANTKHVGRMNIAAMCLLLVFMLFDDRIAAAGMAIVFLIFGASMALLAVTVWATQDYPRRLPIAVTVAAMTVVALLASYAVVVNDLLFDDAMTELATAAAITIVAKFIGVRWAGNTLSRAPFAIGASTARPRLLSGQ